MRRRHVRARERRRVLAAVLLVLAVLLVWHAAGELVTIGAATAAGWLAGHRGRPLRGQAVHAPAERPPEPAPAAPVSLALRRARRNGWAPPARPATTTIEVSLECAAGECAICPGGPCRCPCQHDSKVIVAANRARASAGDTDHDPVPF